MSCVRVTRFTKKSSNDESLYVTVPLYTFSVVVSIAISDVVDDVVVVVFGFLLFGFCCLRKYLVLLYKSSSLLLVFCVTS